MEVVPREYAELPDGTPFLQYTPRPSHLLFAKDCRKACQLGLCALVGDGVHDLQPSATNQTGQLYIIHGVMPNSVDFRLLLCHMKTERVYDVIYGKLKDAITEAGGSERLRFCWTMRRPPLLRLRGICGTNGTSRSCAPLTSRTAFNRALCNFGDKFVYPVLPAFAKPVWNHPAGPKTVFFWAPTIKWGLVIAGIADLARPAEKLSVY
ncbi:hypothetical protein OSTOST_17499, partial [Ostertagia ostertagi]